MNSPDPSPASQGRWTSLWVVALLSLLGQLWLCQFFSFGQRIPMVIDINPSNLWKFVYHFPPTGTFEVLNWLGVANLPQPLNPFSLAAHLGPWLFFTLYAPVIATLSLLVMAAFLRELECPRPAALFGGVIYAWQGDLLPFVFPAHFGYITTWPFFAVAAWGALCAQRTRHWAYAVVSGAGCGLMVELQADRGAIASLLIAALYLAPLLRRPALPDVLLSLRQLALCTGVALLISLASLLTLFQGNVVGVKLGGQAHREQAYKFSTQFSLGPEETVTYLVPGFFGWHINSSNGPYWGSIGRTFDWPKGSDSTRNYNVAISTTGTVATVLGLIGACLLLPGRWLGPDRLSERQRFYGRVLLALGFITLILSWGWHTPLYRPLFVLPLMDKWRNPLKWLEMTNFALITLSAFGVQHLLASLEAEEPGAKIVRRSLTWFSGGMFVLLGLGLMASYPYAAYVLPIKLPSEGYEPRAVADIMNTLHGSLLGAFVLMALFCFLLYALWRPDWLRGLTLVNPWLHRIWQEMLKPACLPLTLALGLILLSVAQLGWVATQFIQPIDLGILTESNPLLEALRSEGNTVRFSVATEDSLLDSLLLNQFNAANLSCIDISAASRIPDDLNTFFNTLDHNQQRLWLLAGVKNVAVPQQYLPKVQTDPDILRNIDHADGFTLVPTGSADLPSHALVTMRDYLAKATLVPHAEDFPADKALLARLKDPAWNPRDSILINRSDPGQHPPLLPPEDHSTKTSSGPDKVDLKTYTPTEIEIGVQSAQGGYILINDQYDPDWHVQVDGHDRPLLRADYILRAVKVPPGDVTVTLHYAAHYHVSDMIRQMTGINVGTINLSAKWMGIFSDGVMLAAWLVAGIALTRRKPGAPIYAK